MDGMKMSNSTYKQGQSKAVVQRLSVKQGTRAETHGKRYKEVVEDKQLEKARARKSIFGN
jgi:hypothetical protein